MALVVNWVTSGCQTMETALTERIKAGHGLPIMHLSDGSLGEGPRAYPGDSDRPENCLSNPLGVTIILCHKFGKYPGPLAVNT